MRLLAALAAVLLAAPAWAASTRTTTIYLPAAGCRDTTPGAFFSLQTTTPPGVECISEREGVLAYADAANEGAVTSFRLPATWVSASGINASIAWRTNTDTGAVGWCVQLICTADNESINPGFPALGAGNCVSDTAAAGPDNVNFAAITGVTATGCAAGEIAWVRVSRDGAGTVVTDSVTQDADLIGLELTMVDTGVTLESAATGVLGGVQLDDDLGGTAASPDVVDVTCTGCIDATNLATDSCAADEIAADSVALTTDTTGNYVTSVATSVLTGLTGGAAASEGATLTLGLDYSQALTGDVGLAANACVFGTSGLVCEGATANTIELFVAVPDAASTDKTLTLPNETGTLCSTGSVCTGYQAGPLTGDVTTTGAAATIAANSVALETDTTGNFVESITTSVLTGLTGGLTAAEGTDHTLGFDYSQALTGDVGLAANACVFGTSGLVCEGATANTIELFVAVPDAASTDKTLTLPNETGTLCSTGSVCTGYAAGTAGVANDLGCTGCVDATDIATSGVASAEILDGTVAQADIDDAYTLAGNPAMAASELYFGTTGLIFEGATADTVETLLTAADPTSADKTLTLPNETGTLLTSATTATKSIYWPADSLTVDGTVTDGCNYTAAAVINGGPKVATVTCADNATGIIYGHFTTPDNWDAGTITLEANSFTADATIDVNSDVLAFDVSCMIRGDGDVLNSTWGTAVALDTTYVDATAYAERHATSTAITCNSSTPVAGDEIYWRAVIDNGTTDATMADVRILGFKMEYGIVNYSDN